MVKIVRIGRIIKRNGIIVLDESYKNPNQKIALDKSAGDLKNMFKGGEKLCIN